MPNLYNPQPFTLKHKATGKIYRITENTKFISYTADKFEKEEEQQPSLFINNYKNFTNPICNHHANNAVRPLSGA